MIIDLNYRVDILKGIVSQNAEHPLYYDDQNAHRVNVSLYRGQEEIDLSGLSCNGYVVFVKEGASIGPLTGEVGGVSNNTCSVVLPHEAYQHPGAIRVEIKLIEGDSVTTVLMLTGHVSSGRGDRIIDITGTIVPSLDSLKATIEELERRVAAIEVSEIVELERKVVRHDTDQGLTNAQQVQARENIGIDGAVNFAEQGSTQSVTASGVTATRTGNRVTLSGTTTYNGALRFRMGGSLTSRTATPTAAQNAATFGAVTVSGRIYVCEMRLISGTATGGVNESPMYVTPMKAGTTSAYIGPNLRRSDYYSRAFVSDGTGAVLWIGVDPGTSFADAVFEVTFRDTTVATQENENIAPADAPVATATHAAGSMLTVGGQLYKATQAIVAGDTITPGTNVASTTVAAQLAERDTAIAAVEEDAEDIFMEPWQLVAKKYFLPDSSGNLTVRRNHITYRPSASQSSPAVRSLIGAYEGANTTLGGYTPTIDQLIPVSVFGDAIKIGFYLDAAGTTRYPRFAYKFCTVDGETVTPISGAQGSIPATAATDVLAETTAAVPDGATHVFFGLLYSNGYTENATYDMVYKVDKG